MAYVTRQEIIDLYGRESIIQLTDRADPPQYRVDEALLQRAIDAAQELADSYLGRRHQVPLATAPVVLRDHVMALAFYNLHRGVNREIEEQVRAMRDEAIAWLGQVAKGLVTLVAAPPPSGGSGAPAFVTCGRTFDHTTLRYF